MLYHEFITGPHIYGEDTCTHYIYISGIYSPYTPHAYSIHITYHIQYINLLGQAHGQLHRPPVVCSEFEVQQTGHSAVLTQHCIHIVYSTQMVYDMIYA